MKFRAFRTVVCTRENMLSFFELQLIFLIKENHVGASTSTHADNKMLHTEKERPRGRGGQGESARNGGGRREQKGRHDRNANNNSKPSESKGSKGGAKNRQERPTQNMLELWPERPQRERMLEETS